MENISRGQSNSVVKLQTASTPSTTAPIYQMLPTDVTTSQHRYVRQQPTAENTRPKHGDNLEARNVIVDAMVRAPWKPVVLIVEAVHGAK
jgi:hypothetical protein